MLGTDLLLCMFIKIDCILIYMRRHVNIVAYYSSYYINKKRSLGKPSLYLITVEKRIFTTFNTYTYVCSTIFVKYADDATGSGPPTPHPKNVPESHRSISYAAMKGNRGRP